MASNETKNPRRAQMRGPGGPGGAMTGEKAKDFKQAVKRLLKELKGYKVLIIISLILAIAGAVLSISAPNKLSELTDEIQALIAHDRKELAGDFCRGCGYCMPCPKGIQINQCARMSLMLRRAPAASWLNDHWQAEMKKIEECLNCGKCKQHCPYHLNTPELLKKNYEDYKTFLK